jgi:hypothetical protein
MRPARPFGLAILGVTAVWLGCTSLAGLSGGGAGDAATDAADAPGNADGDGGLVTPDSGDAAQPVDATTGDGDAGFCAQQQGLQLCADFDENGLQLNWHGGLYLVDASMVQDDADFRSAPNSALVELAPFTAGKEVAKLQQGFMATPSSVHITMELKLEQVDNGVEFLPLVLSFTNGVTGSLQLSLDIAPTGWELYLQVFHPDGGELQASNYFSSAPSPGAWTHIDLQLTFAGTGGTVAGTLNGDASALAPSGITTDGISPPFEVDLGGQALSASTGWRARIDNFTLAFQ